MGVGIKGIMGNKAGQTDKGISTLLELSGKMFSSSKGVREVLEGHGHELSTPETHMKVDTGLEKKSTNRHGQM